MLPGVPGWVWIIGFIAINSPINLRGITFTARANNTILIAEIVVLTILWCWDWLRFIPEPGQAT